MKISIIGLGAMGKGLAQRLLACGLTPIVWNRSPEAVKSLKDEGAVAALNLNEALAADIVFFALYDDNAVRSVILTPDHLKAINPGAILIGTSTISIALAEELDMTMNRLGASYVAMLMFGRPDKARSGELQLAIGGAPGPVSEVMPIMEHLGKPWVIGQDSLSAHAAKLAGNYLIACSIGIIGESAAIAASTGAEPAKFLEMMTQTLFSAPITQFHAGPIIQNAPPDDKAGLNIVLKDVLLGLQHTQKVGITLPIAETLVDRLKGSQKAGLGSKSAYGIYELSKTEKSKL